MLLYKIKDFEVPLFPVRYMKHIFGSSRSAILRKEERGHLPAPNFKTEQGNRLYSIEDLAIIDYIYKEVWPYKQGKKVPEWVKEVTAEALAQSKRVVLHYGKSLSEDDWKEVHQKYTEFDRFRLQLYIESWRRRLLDCDKFFPELVDEDEE